MVMLVENNVYIQPSSGSEDWQSHEAARLRSMDEFLASITATDLMPVIDSLRSGEPDAKLNFIDIGAGTGDATELLCDQEGLTYVAFDANSAFLDKRPTDPSRKVLGRSEDLVATLETAGQQPFDITYSRAVTAWNKDPNKAIEQQLRSTKLGGVAVFTEFDWRSSGIDMRSPFAAKFMQARAIMMEALTLAGFRPEYGADFGHNIDRAAERQGLIYERHETRHELPAGDYREIFLTAANTVVEQLRAVGGGAAGQAHTLASLLAGLVKDISSAEQLTFRLPALVTQVVQIADPDKLATEPVKPWVRDIYSKFGIQE